MDERMWTVTVLLESGKWRDVAVAAPTWEDAGEVMFEDEETMNVIEVEPADGDGTGEARRRSWVVISRLEDDSRRSDVLNAYSAEEAARMATSLGGVAEVESVEPRTNPWERRN